MPSSGRNYLFTGTIVTPTSVSMNALTRTDSPWSQEPSISLNCLRNMVTYNNATGIDGSHSTLYVGGATFSGLFRNPWSYEYVYWLRILSYSTTPTTSTGSCTMSSSTSSSLSSVYHSTIDYSVRDPDCNLNSTRLLKHRLLPHPLLKL